MAKSTVSRRRNKPAKPDTPYDGAPLFPHDSGRWAKKINGRLHDFGCFESTFATDPAPLDDSDRGPYCHDGRTHADPSAGGDDEHWDAAGVRAGLRFGIGHSTLGHHLEREMHTQGLSPTDAPLD